MWKCAAKSGVPQWLHLQPWDRELCTDICAAVQGWGSGCAFKCIALKFSAQHVLKTSAKWGVGVEGDADFYHCTIWIFYICILAKMLCQFTILMKSLLPCKSYNYLVTTPGSMKIKDLAQHYPWDSRDTRNALHTLYLQTDVRQHRAVCLPSRNLLKCCREAQNDNRPSLTQFRFLESE